MGPVSVSLTLNVLLKNQKEKKGLVLKTHTVIYEKLMGQIVNLTVALLSILVPFNWKWPYFFAFCPGTWWLLSICSSYNDRLEDCQIVKESTWHTLFSKSVLGIDWGIGLISMVSLQTYWVLLKALHSKLVICFSSRDLQFFEINSCSDCQSSVHSFWN